MSGDKTQIHTENLLIREEKPEPVKIDSWDDVEKILVNLSEQVKSISGAAVTVASMAANDNLELRNIDQCLDAWDGIDKSKSRIGKLAQIFSDYSKTETELGDIKRLLANQKLTGLSDLEKIEFLLGLFNEVLDLDECLAGRPAIMQIGGRVEKVELLCDKNQELLEENINLNRRLEIKAGELQVSIKTCDAILKAKEEVVEALAWAAAAADFAPGGNAREGWLKICEPLLRRNRKNQAPGLVTLDFVLSARQMERTSRSFSDIVLSADEFAATIKASKVEPVNLGPAYFSPIPAGSFVMRENGEPIPVEFVEPGDVLASPYGPVRVDFIQGLGTIDEAPAEPFQPVELDPETVVDEFVYQMRLDGRGINPEDVKATLRDFLKFVGSCEVVSNER